LVPFREANAGANLGAVEPTFFESVESADRPSIEAACDSTEWSTYENPAVIAVITAVATSNIPALVTAIRQALAPAVESAVIHSIAAPCRQTNMQAISRTIGPT
jgi:hypothetical protein